MAEFSETMKQWGRFCKSHKHCGECPFDGKGICGEAHLYDDLERVERTIMQWAAAHPEPVYPTLGEFIRQRYREECGRCTEISLNRWLETTHIPADIAEKLGIKPEVRDVT